MDKAFISILAAIAIPAYQDYTARAQATEAIKATAGLQTDIGVFVADQNRYPQAADIAGIDDLDGKYFDDVTLTGGDAATINTPTTKSVITVTFNAGANNGETVTLTPTAANGQITQWTCGGTVGASRLPKSCQ